MSGSNWSKTSGALDNAAAEEALRLQREKAALQVECLREMVVGQSATLPYRPEWSAAICRDEIDALKAAANALAREHGLPVRED